MLVEFALIFPILTLLLFGILGGAGVMDRRMSVSTSALEGARYGAVLSQTQCSNNGCGGLTWAQLVQKITVERSNGVDKTAEVCVALVSGPGSAPVAVTSAHTTAGGLNPCFVDNSSDTGTRVQVLVRHPDTLDGAVLRLPVTLTGRAVARFEQ